MEKKKKYGLGRTPTEGSIGARLNSRELSRERALLDQLFEDF